MKMRNIRTSLLIALLSVILDQIVHISLGYYHQIFYIFKDPGTGIYIGSKFLLVFLIGLIVLNIHKPKNKYIKSLIIAIVSAFIFSIILSYLFPEMYDLAMHMFHAVVIFIASAFVLFFKKYKKTEKRKNKKGKRK